MKKSKIFKKVFGDPLKPEKVKEWYVTTRDVPHTNKKKDRDKKACRNRVREDPFIFPIILSRSRATL
jgi:hypothetical protein